MKDDNDGIPVPTLTLREKIPEGYFPGKFPSEKQNTIVLETVVLPTSK